MQIIRTNTLGKIKGLVEVDGFVKTNFTLFLDAFPYLNDKLICVNFIIPARKIGQRWGAIRVPRRVTGV